MNKHTYPHARNTALPTVEDPNERRIAELEAMIAEEKSKCRDLIYQIGLEVVLEGLKEEG